MYFILQVCKVEEKDLVHLCDVDKSFKYFVNNYSIQWAVFIRKINCKKSFKINAFESIQFKKILSYTANFN